MGRLSNLRPRLRPAPSSRLQPADQTRDQKRLAESPWRAWYTSRRWRKLRWKCLVRDGFTCQRCGRLTADTSQLVADHKVPHRGDPDLFWDLGNLAAMCAPCHNSAKQREERRGLA